MKEEAARQVTNHE